MNRSWPLTLETVIAAIEDTDQNDPLLSRCGRLASSIMRQGKQHAHQPPHIFGRDLAVTEKLIAHAHAFFHPETIALHALQCATVIHRGLMMHLDVLVVPIIHNGNLPGPTHLTTTANNCDYRLADRQGTAGDLEWARERVTAVLSPEAAVEVATDMAHLLLVNGIDI